MDQYERYKKTDEVVSKFKNGQQRFRESATFNRAVQMLVRGADPLEVIDQLTLIIDDTNKAFEQYIHRLPKY